MVAILGCLVISCQKGGGYKNSNYISISNVYNNYYLQDWEFRS